MDATVSQAIEASALSARAQLKLEAVGIGISRYGLVVVLLLIGLLKFTAAEAAGIQPLVAHSPFMSWTYTVLSVQGVSNLIGAIEIAIAVLMALRPFSPHASFVGSLGGIVTFVLTTSFLFSTPGAVQLNHGWPLLGDAGQFLIKDVVLLGASFWTAAEALRAVEVKSCLSCIIR
jgi:reactive chlorine resistance protein C